MKAPDKIYAGTITEGFGISKRWQVCRNYLENPVEYIRKDLLLEWTKELTSKPYDGTTESAHKHQIANYLLEKYNSL